MAFLIGEMWLFLLLVGVLAAAAGWMWHAIRSANTLRDLEHERERLRGELLTFVTADPTVRAAGDERASAIARAKESVAEARVAELERLLAEVREQRDDHAGRAAELQRLIEREPQPAPPATIVDDRTELLQAELDRAKAEHEAAYARIAAENAAEIERITAAHASELARLSAPQIDPAARAQAWRLRYFEARTRYLESELREAASRGPNLAALVALETERDEARAELAALRARPVPAPDDGAALKWRLRYLEARNRYLEGEPRDAAASAETQKRRAWRLHYLEGRVTHLEGLRRALAAPAGDTESARLKWRARYLDARVRHLESRLTQPAAAIAPAADAEAALPMEPPPLVPAGAEERPAGLPAARNGAPDDLTLIDGIAPKTETTLHALGIFHFDQIAGWSRANIAWVDQYLRFRGRIVREQWVEQAQDLARGAHASRKLYFETESA